MSTNRLLNIFLLCLSLLLVQCGSSSEDYGPDQEDSKEPPPIPNLYPYPDVTVLNCPKGTLITYENFGSGFMSRFCLACHSKQVPIHLRAGAPENVNFDTSEDIQRYRALISLRTTPAAKNPMPPTREIPKTQRTILSEWLDCGAPSLNR